MGAGFAAVKQAFQSNYACMGITCADIGGIMEGGVYLEGAAPCVGTITGYEPATDVKLTGYEPRTDVTQHSRIDLDQAEMETHLAAVPVAYDKAKQIYTMGGNSGGNAQLTVAALPKKAVKGMVVTQGASASGTVKKDADAGATSLTVSYATTCKEGGSDPQDSSGCFTTSAALTLDGTDVGQPSAVVNKYRTLAGFSTAALTKMSDQEFYIPYHSYYNNDAYAHTFVMSALEGTGAFAGQADIARIEGAKKGSAYMNVWMYVIREMEDAIADCKAGCLDCNDDPVHAWDEAVAFYSGSLEGVDGTPPGKLLHELADKRCKNFGSCVDGNTGMSKVNIAILEQFTFGKNKLLAGKCTEAIPIKKRIVALMSIPMVQGSLRYAYKVGKLSGEAKEKAEGAAFSAAILPRVAACNADHATIISDNMKMDAATPMGAGFAAVKQAFESNYACMGITCADIGGLLEGSAYFEGAAPCVGTITGYEPATDVTQHSRIDLDQAEMETHLQASPVAYEKAKQIYNLGGNSGGYAQLKVNALMKAVTKGMFVVQGQATGHVKKDAAIGATSLTVSYSSTCKEGGSSFRDSSGCFSTSTTIKVGSVDSGKAVSTLE